MVVSLRMFAEKATGYGGEVVSFVFVLGGCIIQRVLSSKTQDTLGLEPDLMKHFTYHILKGVPFNLLVFFFLYT